MDDQIPQPPQPSQAPKQPQKPLSRHGKRAVWQWVVLYAIVGAVVYGLAYYFFIRGSGGVGPTY